MIRCQQIFPHARDLRSERDVPVSNLYKNQFLLQMQHCPHCQGLQSGLTARVKAILLTLSHVGIICTWALLKYGAATAKRIQVSPTRILTIRCSTASEVSASLITECQTCSKQLWYRAGLPAVHVKVCTSFFYANMADGEGRRWCHPMGLSFQPRASPSTFFFPPKFSKLTLKSVISFFLSTTTMEMMLQNPALMFWNLILIPA